MGNPFDSLRIKAPLICISRNFQKSTADHLFFIWSDNCFRHFISSLLDICTGQAFSLPHNSVLYGRLFHYMIFPYLSLTPPENAAECGISPGVRQLTGSMGRFTPPWFSPSRPSTEVSLCCDGSSLMYRKLSGTYRPVTARILRIVSALAADVAPHHRFVPDECIFFFQGS